MGGDSCDLYVKLAVASLVKFQVGHSEHTQVFPDNILFHTSLE